MAPKLYMIDPSPPVRSVLLTAKALGITLEHVLVHILQDEHLSSDYLKLNPQHTVPTLDDNGVVISDNHAISIYLVTKYGKNDLLYPNDLHIRAIINQRLHFNSGVLFPATSRIIRPILRNGVKTVPPENIAEVIEAYGYLEKFLEGHQWIAGDNVTLADLSLIPTVTSVAVVVPIDEKKFPNIVTWIKRVELLPYYSVNEKGQKMLQNLILDRLNPFFCHRHSLISYKYFFL